LVKSNDEPGGTSRTYHALHAQHTTDLLLHVARFLQLLSLLQGSVVGVSTVSSNARTDTSSSHTMAVSSRGVTDTGSVGGPSSRVDGEASTGHGDLGRVSGSVVVATGGTVKTGTTRGVVVASQSSAGGTVVSSQAGAGGTMVSSQSSAGSTVVSSQTRPGSVSTSQTGSGGTVSSSQSRTSTVSPSETGTGVVVVSSKTSPSVVVSSKPSTGRVVVISGQTVAVRTVLVSESVRNSTVSLTHDMRFASGRVDRSRRVRSVVSSQTGAGVGRTVSTGQASSGVSSGRVGVGVVSTAGAGDDIGGLGSELGVVGLTVLVVSDVGSVSVGSSEAGIVSVGSSQAGVVGVGTGKTSTVGV